MMASESLTMGEVTHRSGMAASALRYYEREGLISATRTTGGQRRYERGVLRRLAFIRAAAQIAALTNLRDGLDSCIGCGCLSLARCRISNPGDAAANYGVGAVYLPAALRRSRDGATGD